MPQLAPDDLLIREIASEDAPAAARLSGELGYPVSSEIMAQRIEFLTRSADDVVFVACLAGSVTGWIHVALTRHLQVDARAEIGGLVVSSEARSRGVGRGLVERAESWALRQNVDSMVVRSRDTREAAHRFYLRQGYARTKTSTVFTKTLVRDAL
jgi:GNAT superfamily N-acetyltransferase